MYNDKLTIVRFDGGNANSYSWIYRAKTKDTAAGIQERNLESPGTSAMWQRMCSRCPVHNSALPRIYEGQWLCKSALVEVQKHHSITKHIWDISAVARERNLALPRKTQNH